MATLGSYDYAVIALALATSLVIGVYYRCVGGRQRTTSEYLLADRSMSVLPVAISLMASFMSAITMLGLSMEIYQYGTMFVVINLSYAVATPLIAHIILPVFYRLKTASVNEYVEARFGYWARLGASLAYTLQMVLYMGIVLYAPSLALEAVTGLSRYVSVVFVGVVCTFYATLGGLKAVLITDIYQSLLMFVALYIVIVCAALKAGGLADIWHTAAANGRIDFANWSLAPTERTTWLTQMFGGMTTYLAMFGVNQTQVQRMLAVRNLRAAQAAVWCNLPILCLLSVTTCFSGLCIYWYYHDCDPLLAGRVASRDQIMPLFVVDTLSAYAGLPGLFVSGIFCASLSSISSAITALAAVTLEDYIRPLCRRTLNDRQTLWCSKSLSLFYGLVCIALALLAGSIGGLLQASITIFGVVGGPLLGLFTLGMCTTTANQAGALCGLLTGLLLSFWIGFGQPRPQPPTLGFSIAGCAANASNAVPLIDQNGNDDDNYFYLYRLSYMWYSVIGFLITLVIGLLVSWLCAILAWDNNARIYNEVDATQRVIRHELFVPPLARRLYRQQALRVRKDNNKSIEITKF